MDTTTDTAGDQGQALTRWECTCTHPPVLLGTFDHAAVYIKARGRYWSIEKPCRVYTLCPRCGRPHALIPPEVR